MDIISVFDRMVVVLQLADLCRDRLLDVCDALVQPGDDPLQRLCVLHAGKESYDLVERLDRNGYIAGDKPIYLILQGGQRVANRRVIVSRSVLTTQIRRIKTTRSISKRQDISSRVIRLNGYLHIRWHSFMGCLDILIR